MSGSATLTIELSITCMSAASTTANAMKYLCGSPRGSTRGAASTTSCTAVAMMRVLSMRQRAFARSTPRTFAMLAGVEGAFELIDDEGLHVIHGVEALADHRFETFRIRAKVLGEGLHAAPAIDAAAHDAGEEVGGKLVVVAAVAGKGDAFNDPALEEAASVGADAGFAHAEVGGEFVERAGGVGEQEQGEQAAGD